MRTFVVTGPGESGVQDLPEPVAAPGQVVVEIARVGVCGTDVEFFGGEMAYLHSGHAAYPMRLGHEWAGTVVDVAADVDRAWLGRRVTGDTMLGCGLCARCRAGRQHVCEERYELGVRGGFAGALAERMAVPASSLHALPDTVDDQTGALVEPGGNALRAVWASGVQPGERLLVLGPGTIGLLAAMLARALGAQVHLAGRSARSRAFAEGLGFDVSTTESLPAGPWDGVIDATNAPTMPARAVELVEPGRNVAFIGLSTTPSLVDSRDLLLKDVTATGILSGSPGLAGTIEQYASGAVDPRPIVAATVGLAAVSDVLAGRRPAGAGDGPKFHVDPRR